MLPKGILFDLDDTIIAYGATADSTWWRICGEYANQSDRFDTNTLYRAIREMGNWYWSDKERHKTGRQDLNSARRQIVSLAFQKLNIIDNSLAWKIADTFSEQREEDAYLFEGAEETLEYFNDTGVSLALITNGASDKQRNKIERFNLKRFFKSILIEGEVGIGKPEEAIYLKALDKLKLKPKEVWMVGDNLEWEVEAPQKLGIFSIWNDYAKKGLPPDSRIIPDRIIHHISELMD